MSTQEKQASYPEINVAKHIVTAKGPLELGDLGITCYAMQWMQFFSVLQEEIHH